MSAADMPMRDRFEHLPMRECRIFNANQFIKRRDAVRHRLGDPAGQQRSQPYAQGNADQAASSAASQRNNRRISPRVAPFARKMAISTRRRMTDCSDAVADEKHADDQRNQAHGGDIELKGPEHRLHLLAARCRDGDPAIRRHNFAQCVRDKF